MRTPAPLIRSGRAALLFLMYALGSAGPGRTQDGVLGMGVGGVFGGGPIGSEPPARAAPVARDPAEPVPAIFFLRAEDGELSESEPVFGRGDRVLARVRAPGQRGGAPPSLVLERGGSEVELALSPSVAGPDWYEATFPAATLFASAEGPGPHQTVAIYSTSDNGDDAVFAHRLDELAGSRGARAGGLPRGRVLWVHQDGSFEGAHPDGLSSEADFAGGGAEAVPVRLAAASGVELTEGVLYLSAGTRWIYFSGHYPHLSGGSLRIGTSTGRIHPESVAAKGWRNEIEVVLFASCYAVSTAGVADPAGVWSEDEGKDRALTVTGPAWWKRFEGTLLGYRYKAPSEAAAAVTRRFLDRVGEGGVAPADKVAYSRFLALRWMEANGTHAAFWASAFDSEGGFYFFDLAPIPPFPAGGRGQAPEVVGRIAGRRLYRVPRAGWDSGAGGATATD